MRTTSAAHTPRIPHSCLERDQQHRRADEERPDHREREERPVARADEDPVEREDGPRQRLHEREERPQERRLVEHRAIAREDPRQDAGEREHRDREHAARGDREPDHARARVVGALGAPRAELPPDDDLTRDRDRVEHEREEDEELERDLVRADRRLAEPGRDRACERERA